jgi:ankyrin repeat protein
MDDLLWISADPGCGKSVLARSLIDNELQITDTHTTCYFFFKDNDEQDSLATALCALLHQLFSAQKQLLQYALASWDKNSQKLQSEVYELWQILITAVTSEDAYCVTIVMDALDECREKDRQTLIGLLSKFYVESPRPASRSSYLKFLVTSRPYNEIEDDFREIGPRLPTIRLHGERKNDRIHKEIDLVIRRKVATLADENALSHSTTEKLKQKLLDMKNRTYLWLHLAIQDIKNTFKRSLQPDSESIESLLLPTSVEDAYEKILTRVPDTQKEVVTHIFHIIVGARRPLTTCEMAMSLGILRRRGGQSLAEFKIAEDRLKGTIRDLCGLFVFINHSKIYLIHQTAKEFLVERGLEEATGHWRHSLDPSESETIMARICVEYLSLDELYHIAPKISKGRLAPTHHTIQNDRSQSKMDEEHEIEVLLLYSSEHWAAHFQDASFELKDAVISKARELCRVEGDQFQLWFPLLWRALRPYESRPRMNDIRLAAFNGHEVILRMILDAELVDLEAHDLNGQTALMWAAENGHEKVVQMLLDKGADLNAQDGSLNTVLQRASRNGHETVVQMLLDKGADLNALSGSLDTALQAASRSGQEKVVQILLDKGADVNAQSGSLDTALQPTSWSMRVSKGSFGTALQEASSGGHEKLVQILLDKGADMNAQHGSLGTALQAASRGGHEKVVQMLLDKGADVNAQGGLFNTALQAASWGGHEKVVQTLLDKGADVNALSVSRGTALQAASEEGHEKVVQILLEKGADVNAQDRYMNTALQAASQSGNEKVVQILLEKGADVNAQHGFSDTALYAASRKGYEKVVQMLLDKGADVNAQDRSLDTALHTASRKGYEKVVQMLLDKGADMNAQNRSLDTALRTASREGHEKVMQILREQQHLATLRMQTQKRAIQAESSTRVSKRRLCLKED